MTMTQDEHIMRTGFVCRLGGGVLGGLVGGVVFGIMMQWLNWLPTVAKLAEGNSVFVGWCVHMAIAAFVGATFAIIFGAMAEALAASTVLGLLYGAIWWVLGGLTLMPLRLGGGLFVFNTAAWQSLAGHLLYGLALGIAYALVMPLHARPAHPVAQHRATGQRTPAQWTPSPRTPAQWMPGQETSARPPTPRTPTQWTPSQRTRTF
ncbi:MAG TPA: hypothetical protein VHI50_15240 [Micromonosporaceae bacterium]|jgi:hypothetical protein|nr:hypothetical protein [Micromonosporaceae bacterium]